MRVKTNNRKLRTIQTLEVGEKKKPRESEKSVSGSASVSKGQEDLMYEGTEDVAAFHGDGGGVGDDDGMDRLRTAGNISNSSVVLSCEANRSSANSSSRQLILEDGENDPATRAIVDHANSYAKDMSIGSSKEKNSG